MIFTKKNPNAIEQLRGEVLEDKVVNFLLGKVSVTEQKVSKDELLAEDEDDNSFGHAGGVHHHKAHEEHEHVHGPDCNHEHDNVDAQAEIKTTKKKK